MNWRQERFAKLAIGGSARNLGHGRPRTTSSPRGAFGLLYMSIDNLERMTETLGHETGDRLLLQVGARLAHAVRASDSVVHWGGDEFVALLRDIDDPRLVARVSRKLIAACRGPYALGGDTRYVTLRIGYGLFPSDARDIASLLRRAKQAMQALRRGRDGRQTPK
jgi:diguanylate cyclase (GGDEF)-like protein